MLFQQIQRRLNGGNFKSINLTIAVVSGDKLTVIVSPVSKDDGSSPAPIVLTATAAELDTQFGTALEQITMIEDQSLAEQVAAQIKARETTKKPAPASASKSAKPSIKGTTPDDDTGNNNATVATAAAASAPVTAESLFNF